MFMDRMDAARRLSDALREYGGRNPLVLAIPRGAVPMGRYIADALGGELDVVLVHKLGAPGNPEFAIGAIDESGWAYIADYARETGATDAYLEHEKAAQLAAIRRRRARYTPVRPPIDPRGRTVIVIDDGLATGATMISALHALKGRGAGKVVCAVPVAPPDTLERVAGYADAVVCLEAPAYFHAVGQFYASFPQVEDEEVIACLQPAPAENPRNE